MKPRWRFALESALWVLAAFIVTLALIYLASFIIFSMRETGAWFAPAFGMQGLLLFLLATPWLLVTAAIVFVGLLELFVAHYGFAYRRPVLYSVLGITFFVAAGGLIVADTPLHRQLFAEARADRLPVAGTLYRRFGMERLGNVHRGVIVLVGEGAFDMETRRRETVRVLVPPAAMFPYGIDFGEGDAVVVIGDRASGTIYAIGVRKIDEALEERFRQGKERKYFRLTPAGEIPGP